jgi:hypothetical protein
MTSKKYKLISLILLEVIMAKHKVTLNSHCNYGYVEYDDETKKITVSIPGDLEAQKRVEEYLFQTQTMDVPGEHGLREFETVTLNAMNNYEDFGVVLTRLWVNAGVRVEWSMPPGMADNL